MDSPPVYGYSGGEATEWFSVPELGICIPHDPPVNLASTAISGDILHQPGSCYVKGIKQTIFGLFLNKPLFVLSKMDSCKRSQICRSGGGRTNVICGISST